MLMMRIVGKTKEDPPPLTVAKCTGEVYDFFSKNITSSAADLAAVFG